MFRRRRRLPAAVLRGNAPATYSLTTRQPRRGSKRTQSTWPVTAKASSMLFPLPGPALPGPALSWYDQFHAVAEVVAWPSAGRAARRSWPAFSRRPPASQGRHRCHALANADWAAEGIAPPRPAAAARATASSWAAASDGRAARLSTDAYSKARGHCNRVAIWLASSA